MIKFYVMNRFNGKVQFTAEIDCAEDAALSLKLGLAVRWAIKSGADLTGADLTRAYLSGADLTGAYLTRAYLSGAVGLKHEQTHPLASLKYMTAPLQAFKIVDANGEGHINGGIKYEIGKRASVDNASTDPLQTCAAGIHVADLPWCLREFRGGCRILLVEHSVDDIACVPLATDGKYRLHGCTPIKDITDDLKAAGVI